MFELLDPTRKEEFWRTKIKTCTAQKMKFSIKYFFSISSLSIFSVTFNEEFLNEKLHFLCSIMPEGFNVKERAHFMDY